MHTISKGTTNKLYYGTADVAPQGVYLSIEDMLTEVPSLKYFASALNGWASQQDKQITTGQMVNIKRVVGIPFAHGTADLVHGHPALVKPGREEVIAEYAGQQHLLLHDVQIQGETADEQPLGDPWFGQVHRIFTVQVVDNDNQQSEESLAFVRCYAVKPSGKETKNVTMRLWVWETVPVSEFVA